MEYGPRDKQPESNIIHATELVFDTTPKYEQTRYKPNTWQPWHRRLDILHQLKKADDEEEEENKVFRGGTRALALACLRIYQYNQMIKEVREASLDPLCESRKSGRAKDFCFANLNRSCT